MPNGGLAVGTPVAFYTRAPKKLLVGFHNAEKRPLRFTGFEDTPSQATIDTAHSVPVDAANPGCLQSCFAEL